MSQPLPDGPFPRAARHFRVDPRFVHATVVNNWVPTLGVRVLVVVDRRIAESPRRRAILELSAMGAAEVRFANEAGLAELLEAIHPELVVLVLFPHLEAVERAVVAGVRVERLNIGHVPVGPGRAPVHPAVHLGEDERQAIARLEAAGVRVDVQPLPSDKLVRVAPPRAATTPPAPPAKLEAGVRVVNERGLHLRAANQLAQLASALPCSVTIHFEGQAVNAKSLLGLTTLAAGFGSECVVAVDGPGAADGLARIQALFAAGFGEGAVGGPRA
jgi:phosphotransferase system HPr (HPr) family protein